LQEACARLRHNPIAAAIGLERIAPALRRQGVALVIDGT